MPFSNLLDDRLQLNQIYIALAKLAKLAMEMLKNMVYSELAIKQYMAQKWTELSDENWERD